MREDVFKQIESCRVEYEKYHPNAWDKNIKSKTCSRVKNRMCVINNYCKSDQNCIAEAKRVYSLPRGATGNDEAYCLAFVKEVKQKKEVGKRSE